MMPLSAEMQRVGWRARAGVRSTGRHLDRPGNISGRRSRSRPLDRLSSGRTSVQGGPITPGRNRSIATRRILGLVLAREDEPFRGETPGQRRVCVQNRLFDAKGLSASVDRQPIPVSQARFSIVSRDFRFTSVSGNPAIGKAVPGHSTCRGVWLRLEPLPIGEHTIRFAGSYPNAGSRSR